MVETATELDAHGSDRKETGEVALIVEAGGAEVGEMTHLHTGHLQQGVGTHLAEAEAGEGHALQPHLVFARLEVDHELLGCWQVAGTADQPELIGATAAVEVVAACSFEDEELVVASTAKGTIVGATDDEGVVAEAAAEAVAIAVERLDSVITAAAWDHVTCAGVDQILTTACEDSIGESVQ